MNDDETTQSEVSPESTEAVAPRYFVIDCRDASAAKLAEYQSIGEAQESCPTEGAVRVVSAIADLENFSSPQLATIYNCIRRSAKGITSFHDKAGAVNRVWVLLSAYDPEFVYKPDIQEKEPSDMATKSKKTAKKAKTPKTARKKSDGPRGEKMKKIAAMLQRKNGCTAAEVLEATGWPSVSMPAMAKACNLKLTKEKEKGSGKPTRYYGEAKAS